MAEAWRQDQRCPKSSHLFGDRGHQHGSSLRHCFRRTELRPDDVVKSKTNSRAGARLLVHWFRIYKGVYLVTDALAGGKNAARS
jgi:hypothetical protein